MNIKARIVARKVILVYFYERYFVEYLVAKPHLLAEIDKIDKIVKINNPDLEMVDVPAILQNGYYDDIDDEIAYIIRNFFRKFEAEEIDMDYVMQLAPAFTQFRQEVETVVDSKVHSFQFQDMDLMDRVIFLLGYSEYVLLKTPKEVVLNEMIELAKRYGDDSSPKLVHGIGHFLMQHIDGVGLDSATPE